jgi:hypothetical protein
MSASLPISFPSEAEQLHQLAENARGMTPGQRLLAVFELSSLAEALSRAGGHWEAQLQHQARCEQEWQDRMKEFLAAHVADGFHTS